MMVRLLPTLPRWITPRPANKGAPVKWSVEVLHIGHVPEHQAHARAGMHPEASNPIGHSLPRPHSRHFTGRAATRRSGAGLHTISGGAELGPAPSKGKIHQQPTLPTCSRAELGPVGGLLQPLQVVPQEGVHRGTAVHQRVGKHSGRVAHTAWGWVGWTKGPSSVHRAKGIACIGVLSSKRCTGFG